MDSKDYRNVVNSLLRMLVSLVGIKQYKNVYTLNARPYYKFCCSFL